MPSFKDRLNPQVLVILNQIRSGEYLKVVKAKLLPYKWLFLGALVLIFLLLAIVIGRKLSRRDTVIFVPPIIDIPAPTQEAQKTSVFSGLKRSIQDFNTTLPDPAIPVFDNNINLEPTP